MNEQRFEFFRDKITGEIATIRKKAQRLRCAQSRLFEPVPLDRDPSTGLLVDEQVASLHKDARTLLEADGEIEQKLAAEWLRLTPGEAVEVWIQGLSTAYRNMSDMEPVR